MGDKTSCAQFIVFYIYMMSGFTSKFYALSGDQMPVLLGKLSCGINLSEKICSSHRIERSRKVRELPRATYTIESRHVCVNTFKFLHA